jgi:hypothetical protein
LIKSEQHYDACEIMTKIAERRNRERWCYKIEWINKRSQY